jgi:lysophospholipase L1-like esterase
MIDSFRLLSSRPRILLALPVPVFADHWGIRDSIVRNGIIPVIKKIASETRCQYIDLHTPLLDYGYAFPDDIHPNSIGAAVMVEHVYRALFHRDKMHSSGYLNTAILAAPGAECRGAAAGWGEGKDWFSQFEDINRMGSERQADLVLLGNSITQSWGGDGRTVYSAVPELWDSLFKPLHALNFGISGDQTQHILWRIQNGNFNKVKPRVVALEIGVNNFGVHSAKEVAAGIQNIIKALQKKVPSAKILLFGPLPAGTTKEDPLRSKYREVHQIIRGFHNGKSVYYQNLDALFIRPDGGLVEGLTATDGIHLTAAGYRAWASVLIPEARRLMK